MENILSKQYVNNNWHALPVDTVVQQLGSNLQHGLTQLTVSERQQQYGKNQQLTEQQRSWLHRFLAQFNNALIYILVVSAVITICLQQWVDASVILGVVLLNAVIGFLQEGKAEQAIAAIQQLLAPTAQVIRDGQKLMIAACDLVPGDLVMIHRGDKIPADLRLCDGKNLQLQEAILTGESHTVEKQLTPVPVTASLAERYSMLYSGSLVTAGRGLAIVTAIGGNTEIGQINALLKNVKQVDTPLLQQMNHFGRWLTGLILALGVIVFIIGAVVWHDSSTQMFMAVVSLIVAAVPEGIPPVMTIILAIGISRMAKQNAIIRHMPAVETMGAVTTICTDKTGTLTSNSLKVATITTATNSYSTAELTEQGTKSSIMQPLLTGMLLCNEAEPPTAANHYKPIGNPIDVALIELANTTNLNCTILQQQFHRLDLFPYETEHKFMTSLHHNHQDGSNILYLKGAPELVLSYCQQQQLENQQTTAIDLPYWQTAIQQLTAAGQRVIAIAYKLTVKTELVTTDFQQQMIFLGILGLYDPPRPEVALAIRECQAAGIKVKMITGDHAITATAIAKQIGMQNSEQLLTGDDLDQLTEAELRAAAPTVNIYARTSPRHKIRLVQALQAGGEIVAMTGDGVNDAPALKQANIGIAMGQKGADLAKESAAMILADDDFATIVHAVSEGRTIYENLQKAIVFILPTSFAQAFVVITAVLFGLVLPITAVQILWINMITAVTLSIALGFEPVDPMLMQQPPRDSRQSLLSWLLIRRCFLVSLFLVFAVFLLFFFEYHSSQQIITARTVAVNMLVLGEVFYLINCRNLRRSSCQLKSFSNSQPVLLAIAAVLLMQLFLTYLPIMQQFFGTTALNLQQWGYIILSAVAFFILVELEKRLLR